MTAKRAPGFGEGYREFWNSLDDLLKDHKVDIVAGDFNMNLWDATSLMSGHGRRPCVLASVYLWREAKGSGAVPEIDDDYDDAAAVAA